LTCCNTTHLFLVKNVMTELDVQQFSHLFMRSCEATNFCILLFTTRQSK